MKKITFLLTTVIILLATGVFSQENGNHAIPYPSKVTANKPNYGSPADGTTLLANSNQAAANWLRSQQLASGGFPWIPGGTAAANITGPTARGLLMAYLLNGDQNNLDAAIAAGNYLVPNYPTTYTDGDPRFSTHDPLFLEELSIITGDPTYSDFVQTWFWDKLNSGTYGEDNDMDAYDFGMSVVNGRAAQGIVELSPWDLSGTAVGAFTAGETSTYTSLMSAILEGLEQTLTGGGYDAIGLTGGIWSSSITGIDLNPEAGIHSASNTTADLASTLSTWTLNSNTGAWLWSSVADPDDVTNGDAQTTAYAIMALFKHDYSTYSSQIELGIAFLKSLQENSGEFLGYPGAAPESAGSTEVNGECLSAIKTVAPSTVYVDDDFSSLLLGDDPVGPAKVFGYDGFAKIGDAIDAVATNGTINVANGTYVEQLHITKDNITLDGEGKSTTIVKSPATLTQYFSNKKAIVCVDNAIGFVMNEFTIDGDGQGNVNNSFVGLAFWNAGGSVINVDVTGVRETPFSGNQQGVGIYAYNDTGGPYTLAIDGMEVTDFQKNAFALSGDGLTVDLNNISVVGAGSTTITAQNGIQIGFGAGGSVENATITGIDYIDIVPPIPNWTATAVLLYNGGTINLNNVNVTSSQTNVYFIDTDGSFNNGSITSPVANVWANGIDVYASSSKSTDGSMKIIPSPIEENYKPQNSKGTVTVSVENSTFTGILETDCYGIGATADGTIDLTIDNNSINNWDYGIYAYEALGGTVNANISNNNLGGNTIAVYFETENKGVIDASNNYWGDPSGPYHPTLNPDGLGSEVGDNILFNPWLTDPILGTTNLDIDVALYETTCGDFEVRMRALSDLTNTYLTNVQFTVKWPESTVALTNIFSTVGFNIAQQGLTTVSGGFNYAVFVGVPSNLPINWTAGEEYTVLTFSHDESGTGTADFEIADDTWTQNNNAVYYAELLGSDATGIIYGFADDVFLGSCDAQLKVFLQGPYNTTASDMNSDINAAGDLPLDQPFDTDPWNYSGTESVLSFDPTVVDWVLVELRTGTDETDLFERKAGLLLEDGTIAQYDDIMHGIRFDDVVSGDSYYVVVWHRNHMPVMSLNAMALPNGTLYDFSVESNIYGYNPGPASIELETGVHGMIAGDVTADGTLKYSGPSNDRGPIIARIVAETGSNNINGSTTGYWYEDVNLNDVVLYLGSNDDRAPILANLNDLTGNNFLNSVYTCVVPGSVVTAKDNGNNGPLNIQIFENQDNISVNLISMEEITGAMMDNVQFTLAWDVFDTEVETLLENYTSSYSLVKQGPATVLEGIAYQVFASATPANLPDLNSGSEISVITFNNNNGLNISERLWIAENNYSSKINGDYYVSFWGVEKSGEILTSPVGVGTNLNNNAIKLYPNPVSGDQLTVHCQVSEEQLLTITLYDLQGKKIIEQEVSVNGANPQPVNMDVSGFKPGAYMINVSGKTVRFTDMFIVN